MRLALMATITLSVSALAGCAAPQTQDDGRPSVVASTNVYGSIASAVGGDLVRVTNIIQDFSQDPHSYEATAAVRLELSKADLVIQNGGGYDPFVQQLVEADGARVPVLTAVDFAGDAAAGPGVAGVGFNEHVWYDFGVVGSIAEGIADRFGSIDPANAQTYTDNAAAFLAELAVLEKRATGLAGQVQGAGAIVTEPVPAYLLKAVGLVDLSPADFTEAIEEGADVPPAALRAILDVVDNGEAIVLAYNAQSAGPETARVRAAAEAAGIPVVDLTETLPDGRDYLSWMAANLDALESALR